ncbi:CDP-glycerol:glycerophosphate glycerophosphotransferase [Actinomycetota bacterium Odt1-20B]
MSVPLSAAGPSPYRVTLVVPVHDVEPYLQECLDSLAAQTMFGRIQVFLVDNGSRDRSYKICQEFAASRANVEVLYRRGGGAGAARNAGLERATAPYVTFCDADDVLPPGAVERMWKAAVETRAQVVVGAMETFPKRTNWAWRAYFGHGDRTVTDLAELPELVHSASACNKLFALDHVRAHRIAFAEDTHFEDAYFAVPALLLADRLTLVDACVYRYRKRAAADSTMDSLWTRPRNYHDHLALEEYLRRMRPRLPAHRQEVLDRFLVRSYQGFALRAPGLFGEAELRELFARCRAVYAGVDPATIVASTADSRHRVAYLAFLAGDFTLFADPQAALCGPRAEGGRLYLQTVREMPEALRPLAELSALEAHLECVRRVKGTGDIELAGRFELPGLPVTAELPGRLSVRVRGCRLTVPARQVRRRDLAARRADLEWAGFTARVPLDALRPGAHDVRLVLDLDGGQADGGHGGRVSAECRVDAGFLRGARALSDGRTRVLPHWRGGNRAVLVTVAEGTLPRRLRSWRMLLAKDAKQAVRRRSFWRARLVRLATLPLFARRDIWLFGERPDTAQDNSWHLFRHVRAVERRRGAYYVIRADSPDRARLKGLGHVVAHSSWKHKLLMLHATVLVNAYDIDAYMLPDGWDRTSYLKHLNWRVGARRVFLQHGVTDKDVSRGLHRNRTGLDLVLAAGDREARYLSEHLAYRDEVKVLGFPRFDALRREPGHRTVLFMPTWRAYLTAPSYQRPGERAASAAAARESFASSTYREFLIRLLHDARLRAALRLHDYVLEFLPHYEMRDTARDVLPADDRVVLLDQRETGVQDALRRCDLFVTDWSSTAFDVAYLGTPLVHAQFDPDEYGAGHYRKGWFDARRDGFGPVCATVDEVVDELVRYLENGCVREPEYTRRAQEFFAFQDRDNCSRAAAAIAELAHT